MNTRDSTILPLVLGAGGRLGTALQEILAERHPAAVFATRVEVDITDPWRLVAEVERLEPTVIINAASFTHVDGCELDPERANLVNEVGARNVARAARQFGAKLLHLSTDFVFDGRLSRAYAESDEPAPLSVYGRSKLQGERAVSEECPGAVVVRASWFFGAGEADFPENFLRRIEERQPLSIVADRFGSPTYIPDLAEAIARLLHVEHAGPVHFTNSGERTSRYHFTMRAAAAAGLDPATVTPVSQREWKGDRAPRPMNSALDPSLFVRLTGWRPRSWEEALQAYVRARKKTGGDG